MSDLISRQAVLESLKTDYSLIMFDSYGNLTFTGERIIEAIKRVPSVEPGLEQKILRLEEENKKLKQEVRTLYDEAAEAHELGMEQI